MTRGAWIAVGTSSTLAFVLAIALIIVIAVDGDSTDPAPAETPEAAAPQTFGGPLGGGSVPPEVEECLTEQGVEPPGSSGEIPSDEEIERMREAFEACGLQGPQIFTPGS
jgi:hypothetical protein